MTTPLAPSIRAARLLFARSARRFPPAASQPFRRPLHAASRAMAKPKVILFGEIDHAWSFWHEHIDPIADTIRCTTDSRPAFLEQCKAGAYDGAVAAFRTFPSVSQTGPWDAELCAALPSSLHFVAHTGAGYDQLTASALAARGLLACNVPTAVDAATADTALFLLLGALRGFAPTVASLRAGAWRGSPPAPLGHDPDGKLLGVLGLGGIGRNFARKARALGMRVAYHNRRRLDAGLEDGAEYMSFDELLARSDVLSVHVPLNDATRHLLDAAALAKCKKGVVIVNTARGAVIDEAALVDALATGHVASAGLDVYEEEPKIHPGLVDNHSVMLLPHMGTWSVETQRKMEEWSMGNVECAIKGKDAWRRMSVIPEHKDLLDKWLDRGTSGP